MSTTTLSPMGKVLAALAILVLSGGYTAQPVAAAPTDYRFEVVESAAKSNETATIAVRLIHLPDDRLVRDATILGATLDMTMKGAAPMAVGLQSLGSDGAGVHLFQAEVSMAGEWRLSLTAKVNGEPDLIRQSVPIYAAR